MRTTTYAIVAILTVYLHCNSQAAQVSKTPSCEAAIAYLFDVLSTASYTVIGYPTGKPNLAHKSPWKYSAEQCTSSQVAFKKFAKSRSDPQGSATSLEHFAWSDVDPATVNVGALGIVDLDEFTADLSGNFLVAFKANGQTVEWIFDSRKKAVGIARAVVLIAFHAATAELKNKFDDDWVAATRIENRSDNPVSFNYRWEDGGQWLSARLEPRADKTLVRRYLRGEYTSSPLYVKLNIVVGKGNPIMKVYSLNRTKAEKSSFSEQAKIYYFQHPTSNRVGLFQE